MAVLLQEAVLTLALAEYREALKAILTIRFEKGWMTWSIKGALKGLHYRQC